MPNTYKLVIYCNKFPTLKNAKQFRLNNSTKKLFIAASDDWAEWYRAATIQVNQWKTKHPKSIFPFQRCAITIIIFFPNYRTHDIDGIASGVLDLLKVKRKKDKKTGLTLESGTGVIYDDDWKLLRPLTIDAGFSENTPRIEVFITPVSDLSYRIQ